MELTPRKLGDYAKAMKKHGVAVLEVGGNKITLHDVAFLDDIKNLEEIRVGQDLENATAERKDFWETGELPAREDLTDRYASQ